MNIPIIFADIETEEEFWGQRSTEVVSGSREPQIIHISPSLRGIVICTAVEINRIFGMIMIATSCLRTWEQEDMIYPARLEAYGPGYQPGKPAGPHLFGRGIDWILRPRPGDSDRRLSRAYNAGVSYQNKYFPYGYNAPSRLIRGGKIKPLPYKTALAHDVGRGFHVHSQESWRG